jgi:hypothetical protein
MPFSKQEVVVMKDIDFLLTKYMILEKIKEMFIQIRDHLNETSLNIPFDSPGKISRGENYRQLPYLVLDYPAEFNGEHIFTFRTMFWWGHFFSATLHLQGDHLEEYRAAIEKNIAKLLNQSIYIGINKSPWEYHYGKDNYVLLEINHDTHIQTCDFLKLSQKYELTDWQMVPQHVFRFYKLMIEVLEC